MAGPKIKIDTGPQKHVEETKVADVEAHTKAGPNVVKKEAVVDAAHKLPGANQLKPKTVAKTKPPKDIKNTSKKTSKKTNTTHTTNAETPKTPEAPTPNINLINPEPKTTLSVEPVKNIVNDALKIAALANALNPNKNKNNINKLKTKQKDENTKQKELTQQRINIKKENKKTRKAEREKQYITKQIAKLEGKISTDGKQTKRSKSYKKRLNSLTKRLLYITTTEPKAEPAVAKTDPKAPTAEPNAEPKPEPTAEPQIASTAKVVASTAPVELNASGAQKVVSSKEVESNAPKVSTFNNYLTKRLQLPNNTKTKNTKTKKYNTNSEEYQRLLIHDPPAAEIFKEKAKAESKAELEKQVNNSISNIGKLFEETPSNSQKKTKAESNAPKVSNFNNYLTKRLQLPNNTKTKNTKTKKNKLLINTSDAAIERSSISLIHKIDAEQDKAWNVIKEKYRIAGIDVRGDDHAAEKARSEIVKLGVQFEREKQTRIDTHLKTLYNLRTQERLKSYLDKSIKRKEIVNESIGNIGKLFEEPPSNSQKKTKAAEHSAELFKHNNKNSSKAIITNGAPAINILNTKKTQTHENTNTAGEYIEINKFNFNDEIPKNTTNIQNQN